MTTLAYTTNIGADTIDKLSLLDGLDKSEKIELLDGDDALDELAILDISRIPSLRFNDLEEHGTPGDNKYELDFTTWFGDSDF